MGLEFTDLHYFKTDKKTGVDPDEQVRQFVTRLKGKLKKWEVLVPSPKERIIYFEMEDGARPEFVKGSAYDARNQMIGKKIGVKK